MKRIYTVIAYRGTTINPKKTLLSIYSYTSKARAMAEAAYAEKHGDNVIVSSNFLSTSEE